MKRTFTCLQLIDELDLPHQYPRRKEGQDGYIAEDTIEGTSRWSVIHRLVFYFDGIFWETGYSIGATESQDESPWEYEETVECQEVREVERTVKVWENVPEEETA